MEIIINTQGNYDFVDITPQVEEAVRTSGVESGAAIIFVVGSTVALTTMEYEDGVVADLTQVLEKIAPTDYDWQHHLKWGDSNGAAHIKAALIGPDLFVPIEKGKLSLGTWQQIVLIDFDEKPRQRRVIIKILTN